MPFYEVKLRHTTKAMYRYHVKADDPTEAEELAQKAFKSGENTDDICLLQDRPELLGASDDADLVSITKLYKDQARL